MKFSDRYLVILLLVAAVALFADSTKHTAAFKSMDQKVEILQANAQRPPQQPQTTEITEQELNAYFNEGGIELPQGVSDVRMQLSPAVVTTTAKIDFDTLTAGKTINPIYQAMFSGQHDLDVQAQASGAYGKGTVTIQSVKVDGVPIPRSALEYLINRYVKPRYANAGMTTTFALPARIDMAVVQQGKTTLTQK